MYNVKTYNMIAEEGLKKFPADKYTVNGEEEPAAYLIRSQNLHDHEFPQGLLGIARAGAGVNNIPLDDAAKNGTVVFNTPGSNANAVKELIVGMLVMSSRHVIPASAWARDLVGAQADVSLQTEKNKNHFSGKELVGRKIGIIGLGNVGSKVAKATLDLGMEVIGYDPYLSVDHAWKVPASIKRAQTLEEVTKDVEYLTVHVPLDETTRHLVGEKEIANMAKGGILLNFARAGIVDEEAAVAALKAGQLSQFLSDFNSPTLHGVEGVTVTPHLGGTTGEAEVNGAVMAANQLMTFIETGNIINGVNLPDVKMPFNSPMRLTVMHENVPNMVGKITTILANDEINIDNMVNQSKGKWAYTLIDCPALDDVTLKKVKEDIEEINEVVRFRSLVKPA